MTPSTPIIRPMTESDIIYVVQIDEVIHYSSWTDAWFHLALQNPYQAYVLEKEGAVIGFVVIRKVLDEWDLLNIGVAQDYQHQGYGRQLLQHVIEMAESVQCKAIFLEVRASNQAAIHLYEQCGFQRIGIRKDYYQAPQVEDAMLYRFSSPSYYRDNVKLTHF